MTDGRWAAAKAEADKLSEALNIKDEEIRFLRAHIVQLVQSISQLVLKPSEEEIKKKGWWQFWRREYPMQFVSCSATKPGSG